MQPNYDDIPATHDHRQPPQNIHQNHYLHHQQFMENDECCSSLYNISNSLQNLNHHITQKQQRLPPFLQNHSIPITHQLFQAQLPFQPQQHGGDASHSQLLPPRHHRPPHPQNSPVEFRLGLEQNNHNCAPNVPLVLHPQEDSATIKEPFRKQLSTSYCEDEAREVVEEGKSRKLLENKNGSFDGELEAIYGLAKIAEANQTCSGSALTGENSPKNTKISIRVSALQGQNAGVVGAADAEIGVDHGSENSIGEEASLRKRQKRVRQRKMREDLSSMAKFFENLVKQVMDHQEMLHRKFLEVIDKMDNERVQREEEWRKQEAAEYNREAMSRAHEQALASSREAKIISCIEKITGQSMDLPKRKAPFLAQRKFHKHP